MMSILLHNPKQNFSVSTCGVESLLRWMVEKENLMPQLEHMKFIYIAIFPNLLLGTDVDMPQFLYALLAPLAQVIQNAIEGITRIGVMLPHPWGLVPTCLMESSRLSVHFDVMLCECKNIIMVKEDLSEILQAHPNGKPNSKLQNRRRRG